MFKRSTLAVLMAVALAGGLLAVAADQQKPADSPAAPRSDLLSLEEILQRVKAQHPGRVTETELEYKRGRYVYEIDVVGDDGVKKELKYDARTGELISAKVEESDDENED